MKRFVFTISILVVVTLTLIPNFAFSASFDCDKASTDTEKLICANDDLGLLDEMLSSKYKQAISVLGELDKKELKSSQRVWLKLRDKSCDTASNCKSVYSSRITDIEKLISSHADNDQLKLEKIIKRSVSVPKDKNWIIRNISPAECRVCTEDIRIDGGMAIGENSDITLYGKVEINFNQKEHPVIRLFSGTTIYIGDSRGEITIEEVNKN